MGKIVNFKKKSINKKKKIKINYSYIYKKIGLITNFYFDYFLNKIFIAILFADGSSTYINAIDNNKIFMYFTNNIILSKIYKINIISLKLFQFKKLSNISSIELIPYKNSQYARSAGTFSKILKFNKENYTVLLELPSKKKKLFSCHSSALNGKNVFKYAAKLINNKAGFWRNQGIKSTVRGVAKNAVDHPNGGRTKSLKAPKTPWGKITKLK